MLLIGIDEAGYGPLLGPLCHGYCALRYEPLISDSPGANEPPDLWKLLKPTVRRCPAKPGSITVDDSKKVYSTAQGIGLLQRGVVEFLNCAAAGSDAEPTYRRILPEADRARLEEDAWGLVAPPSDTDAEADAEESSETNGRKRRPPPCLKDALAKALTTVVAFGARAMPAKHFNRAMASSANKADVNWSVIAAELAKLVALARPGELIHAVIDRQGGRKFYLGKISELFPGAMPWVEEETPQRSVYRIEHEGRILRIAFVVEADGETMAVALASMAAKLARELCMQRLNAYFRGHAPELRPTAGYYGDAARFLKETRDLRAKLGIDDSAFVRVK